MLRLVATRHADDESVVRSAASALLALATCGEPSSSVCTQYSVSSGDWHGGGGGRGGFSGMRDSVHAWCR